MWRIWGHRLALFAVLLQAAQPLLAAPPPAMPMTASSASSMTAPMAMPASTRPAPCADDAGSAAAPSMRLHGHGCCCHGGWSCSGPCGAAALTAVLPTLRLRGDAPHWLPSTPARAAAAHPLELLRPPIAA